MGAMGATGTVGRRGGAGSGAIGVTMRGSPEFSVGGSRSKSGVGLRRTPGSLLDRPAALGGALLAAPAVGAVIGSAGTDGRALAEIGCTPCVGDRAGAAGAAMSVAGRGEFVAIGVCAPVADRAGGVA